MSNKYIITLLFVLSFFSMALSQGTGTYIIPPGSPYTATTMDSILTLYKDSAHVEFYIDQDSIGNIMWFSEKSNFTIGTKIKSTSYVLTENRWVKLESQFDTLNWSIDYGTKTVSIDSTGNEFWSESIYIEVVDSTEIIVNSTVNVTANIQKAYDFYNPTTTHLNIIGNGNNQSFPIKLKNGVPYVIEFINNGDNIVYIKQIEV